MIYIGDAVGAKFSAADSPNPKVDWPTFYFEIRELASSLLIPEYGFTTADHQIVYNAQLANLEHPADMAGNATNAMVATNNRAWTLFNEKSAAIVKLKNAIVKALGPPALKVVGEIAANGFNLGTTNRTVAQILDRLAAKYGVSTHNDSVVTKAQYMEIFNPEMETFEAFLIRKDTMREFLQANRKWPTTSRDIPHRIPLMLTAITHFEMGHPLAIDQTYEEIIVHLSNIAESNAGVITVHHAINEMKQVPTLAEAVANEVRRQMVNTTSKGDTGRAQRLSKNDTIRDKH